MEKKLLILFLFLGIFTLNFGEDISLERIEELYKNKTISEDDYNFLKAELEGTLQEKHYFSLFINRNWISDKFPIIYKNDEAYISMFHFFKEINFRNYKINNEQIEMYLGRRMERVTLNFKTGEITGLEKTNFTKKGFFKKDDDYFIRYNLFRDIFLNAIDVDHKRTRISMSTRYATPQEIRRGLKLSQEELEKDGLTNNFYYTNSRKLIDLGYMRFNFDKTFTKSEGKKDNDWSGILEYQGPFLYGNLTTEYDVKEETFTSTALYYPNLPHNHFLELRGTKVDNDYWEKSILFEKDKGYFEEGKNFIIRENVPIGSRVELIYLGATIDIQHERNGLVEFKNDEIKNDREYTLKIHTKDGQIITKIIKTSDDFNQQNIGEFQYRLYSSEEKSSNKNIFETEVYYGFTDHITLGGKYYKTPETLNDEYIYLERGGGEFIYSNHIKTYPYTFVLGGEKILTPKEFRERDTLEGLFQIKFDNIKFRYEQGSYSEYYTNHKSNIFLVEYNPWDFLRLDYTYEKLEDFDGNKDRGYTFEGELTHNFGRILSTFSFEKDIDYTKRYSLNLYYTGYRDYSVRWNNSITEAGDDLESMLSLYNRTTKNGIDYSFDISYNEKDKEKFTFRISLDYDNWFSFDAFSKDSGDYEISTGIDRIVDLKNITRPLDSMDSSRAEVITYLDINDNNKFDINEPKIGNVEVEINNEKKITKLNEKTYFHGIPNDILYTFIPKVRRPGYDIINSKFSLKGKGGGDIEVLIPIKPLFSLSGNLHLENLTEEEKIDVYDGVVVKIKDSHNIIINSTLPDQFGYYDISGLTVGDYTLEITSFKNTKIKPLIIPLKVKYIDEKTKVIKVNSTIKDNKIIQLKEVK